MGSASLLLALAGDALAKTQTAIACQNIASIEQANALLGRVLPAAHVLHADPMPLDEQSNTCLLEIEMLADKDDPSSKGFIYILPDGLQFLNGPLMDRRSQLRSITGTEEISEAVAVQQKAVEAALSKIKVVSESQKGLPQPADLSAASKALSTPITQSPAPDPAVQIDHAEAREQFLAELEKLPLFRTQDEGRDVYVMYDPECPFCQKLYKQHESLAERHDLRFNWVPMFLSDRSWAMNAHLLKTARTEPERAISLLRGMLGKTWKPEQDAAEIKLLAEEDYGIAKPASLLFYEQLKTNPGMGTPLVVFRKPDGQIEVISGVPNASDWRLLAKD